MKTIRQLSLAVILLAIAVARAQTPQIFQEFNPWTGNISPDGIWRKNGVWVATGGNTFDPARCILTTSYPGETSSGFLTLRSLANSLNGAEIQTLPKYKYGYYETRLKVTGVGDPANNRGVVVSFFIADRQHDHRLCIRQWIGLDHGGGSQPLLGVERLHWAGRDKPRGRHSEHIDVRQRHSRPVKVTHHPLRVCANITFRKEAQLKQTDPHPDPLPSDGRGNSLISRLQFPKGLDPNSDGGRFSLSYPMGEGRGEGEVTSKSEIVFARALRLFKSLEREV